MRILFLLAAALVAGFVQINAQVLKQAKTLENEQVIQISDSTYYQLDSVYTYLSVNNNWIINSRTNYSYDANGNILESSSQKLENDTWTNTTLISFNYSDNYSTWTQNHLQWNSESKNWQNIWRKSYTEADESNTLNIVYSEWTNNSWNDIWQQDQYYNHNWQLLSYQTVKWNNEKNKWESYWDYNCYYDSEGNLLQTTHKSFNTDTQMWNDEWECTNNYESGNLISEQIMDWDSEMNNWNNITFTDINYSTDKVVKTRSSWNKEQSGWSSNMLITEVKDNLNNITEVERNLWDENSTSWRPQRKDAFTYDNYTIKSSETTSLWSQNTSSWQNNFKKEYFYSEVFVPGDNLTPKDYELVVYPNPASSEIYLKFSGDAELLSIYKMDGTLAIQVPIPNNGQYINVSQLKKGAYIAKISFSDGVAQTKFVKK